MVLLLPSYFTTSCSAVPVLINYYKMQKTDFLFSLINKSLYTGILIPGKGINIGKPTN